jgi:hypothetical protein
MYKFLSLFILATAAKFVYAQSNSEQNRLRDIKAMYNKSEEILMYSENCKLAEKINRKTVYEGSEVFEFKQEAKHCILTNDLSVLEGNFSDWEWDATIKIYQNREIIYFALLIENDISQTNEFRAYFEPSGQLFKLLKRTNYEREDMSSDIEITDKDTKSKIVDYILNKREEIFTMLNN